MRNWKNNREQMLADQSEALTRVEKPFGMRRREGDGTLQELKATPSVDMASVRNSMVGNDQPA